MERKLRADAEAAALAAIDAVLPDKAVERALKGKRFPGRVFPVAVGKAAWRMAAAALRALEVPAADGLVVTKYGHLGGELPPLRFFEAGHPVPDENSVRAAAAALELTEGLREDDTVLFLLSGGGSGRPLRRALRPRADRGADPLGRAGRPAGHDRLRPRQP